MEFTIKEQSVGIIPIDQTLLSDADKTITITKTEQVVTEETGSINGWKQQLADLDAQKAAIQAKIDGAALALNIKL